VTVLPSPPASRRITIVPPSALGAPALDEWSGMLSASPELDSPFLGPGFAEAVDRVRPGVQVAVVEEGTRPVGFFAFQRHAFGLGAPLAAYGPVPVAPPLGLSDHQAVVTAPGVRVDPLELVRACGLSCWSFDHLTVRDDGFAAFRSAARESPVVGTARGYEDWAARQRESGSRLIAELERKRRRLEREVGTVRFETHSAEPAHLAALMGLKREQYRRTGALDRLGTRWVVELLRLLQDTDRPDLAGRLSVLHAGGRVVALHLGLRSRRTWHWWIPAYDPAYARHSPGQILLLEMVRACDDEGIDRIDLGAGDSRYKDRFATDRLVVASGRVGDLPRSVALATGGLSSLRAGLRRHSVLARPLRGTRRALRRTRSRLSTGAPRLPQAPAGD
jgi:CelD/BcsL family acetyltransferase involved in cellulose biosynthesis